MYVITFEKCQKKTIALLMGHYQTVFCLLEHSENKMITQSGLHENEIGPEVLYSSIQQARVLQDIQRRKVFATNYVWIQSFL